MDNLQDLAVIIKGCRDMQKASQEKLYRLFYNYAWAVSIRYISNLEEAQGTKKLAYVPRRG